MLMKENEINKANITIIGIVRNIENAKKIFEKYLENGYLKLIEHNIMEPIKEKVKNIDYIIHAASNAHPKAFTTEPIETLLGNINGTKNMLDLAKESEIERFIYISSGEIYGENLDNIEGFEEEYRGYINNLSFRSCYPIGKVSAENLCVCYSKQYDIDTVIVRPCHIYGPTVTSKDSRVIAQFISNVLNNEDIIMKSDGKQYRSYCYVIDCITGLLTALIKGKRENAYNIANKESNITIKEMAELIANYENKKVIIEMPTRTEKSGYNVVQKSILKANKLENLGWKPKYNIKEGIKETIKILKDENM